MLPASSIAYKVPSQFPTARKTTADYCRPGIPMPLAMEKPGTFNTLPVRTFVWPTFL
jgi:hypothetical protein